MVGGVCVCVMGNSTHHRVLYVCALFVLWVVGVSSLYLCACCVCLGCLFEFHFVVLDGVCYIERTSIHSPKHVLKTKKAIKKAFQNQIDKKTFSMVEIISPCPTYWGLSPVEALNRIEKEIIPIWPLGVLKDV